MELENRKNLFFDKIQRTKILKKGGREMWILRIFHKRQKEKLPTKPAVNEKNLKELLDIYLGAISPEYHMSDNKSDRLLKVAEALSEPARTEGLIKIFQKIVELQQHKGWLYREELQKIVGLLPETEQKNIQSSLEEMLERIIQEGYFEDAKTVVSSLKRDFSLTELEEMLKVCKKKMWVEYIQEITTLLNPTPNITEKEESLKGGWVELKQIPEVARDIPQPQRTAILLEILDRYDIFKPLNEQENIKLLKSITDLLAEPDRTEKLQEMLKPLLEHGRFYYAQQVAGLLDRPLILSELETILAVYREAKRLLDDAAIKTADLLPEPQRTAALEEILRVAIQHGGIGDAKEVADLLKRRLAPEELEEMLQILIKQGWDYKSNIAGRISRIITLMSETEELKIQKMQDILVYFVAQGWSWHAKGIAELLPESLKIIYSEILL